MSRGFKSSDPELEELRQRGTRAETVVHFADATCIYATDNAILVTREGWKAPVWFPQSQVHEQSEVWKKDDVGTLVVKEWIAIKKGLV